MIYNWLSGDYGHLFFQQVFFDQQADGVGKHKRFSGEKLYFNNPKCSLPS